MQELPVLKERKTHASPCRNSPSCWSLRSAMDRAVKSCSSSSARRRARTFSGVMRLRHGQGARNAAPGGVCSLGRRSCPAVGESRRAQPMSGNVQHALPEQQTAGGRGAAGVCVQGCAPEPGPAHDGADGGRIDEQGEQHKRRGPQHNIKVGLGCRGGGRGGRGGGGAAAEQVGLSVIPGWVASRQAPALHTLAAAQGLSNETTRRRACLHARLPHPPTAPPE